MKKTLAMLALIAAAPMTAAADVPREDIEKLVKGGLSDAVILAYIRANGPVQKLTSDDLVALKSAGATDAVLQACLGGAAEKREEKRVVEKETVVVREAAPSPEFAYSYYVPAPGPTWSVAWCGSHRAYDYCGYHYTYTIPVRSRSYYSSCGPSYSFSYSYAPRSRRYSTVHRPSFGFRYSPRVRW